MIYYMTIQSAIEEAILHFGGKAKASSIIRFVNDKYPSINTQSIKFTLYHGSNGNPRTGHRYHKVSRGVYELNPRM